MKPTLLSSVRAFVALVAVCCAVQAAAAGAIGMRSPQLPAHPQRVVVLEFMLAEAMAALDVTPVGVVDVQHYPVWIGYDVPRLVRVPDVGTRQQPNLEAIARLKPDLIVGFTFRHAALFDALERIAPTVLFEFNSPRFAVDQLAHMQAVFDELASLTGREARGREVKRQLAETLERDRQRIAAAGLAGRQIAVLQELGLIDRYWAYTGNSMAGGIARALGLAIWPPQPTKEGTTFVSTEDLLKQRTADVVLVSTTGPEVSLDTKLASPVWRHVPARRDGRVALMERNVWGFGGPMSAARYADRLTEALLSMKRPAR